MRIDAAELLRAEAGESKDVSITAREPQLTDIDVVSLEVSGRLSVLDDRLLLKARVNAVLQLVCARCLEVFELPVTLDLTEEFADEPSDEQFPIEQDTIDLTEPIRTALLLAVSPQPIHDPECHGLCGVCGKNLNTDPHQHDEVKEDHPFAELQKLKKPKD